MKKKLFLVIAIMAMLACLFAITASADVVLDNSETVTLDDGKICPLYATNEAGERVGLIWYVESVTDGVKSYNYVTVDSEYANIISTGGNAKELNNIYVTIGGTTYDKNTLVVVNLIDAKITGGNDGRKGNEPTFPYNIFSSSKNLEYFYCHQNTTSIGMQAFKGCSNLKYVNIDKLTNLTSIGQQSFISCTRLFEGKVLDFTKTALKSTDTNSLRGNAATEIIFPTTFTSLGQETFKECKFLTKITFNSTLTSVNTNYWFDSCEKLVSVEGLAPTVADGKITYIGTAAFKNCKSLVSVDGLFANGVFTMPSTSTSFGQDAFNGCTQLTTINAGTVTNIGQTAFAGCTALKTFNYDVSTSTYTILYTSAFYGCTALESFAIPSSVLQFYGEAFRGCTALKTIDIPADSNLYDIGAGCFRGCTSLSNIFLPDKVTNVVDGETVVVKTGITSIGNDAFHDSGLVTVRLPSSLTYMGYNTFENSDNLVSIDLSAYTRTSFSVCFAKDCDALKYVSIPEGVTYIDSTAFSYCDELEAVYMPNSVVTLAISGWNNGAFDNNPKMYFVNEPMTYTENYADFKMPAKPLVYYMPTSLKSEQNPSTQGVAQISGPFVNSKNLNTYLVFPEGFTNFYTNDNWFKFCGSEKNPINIVCLGDMTDLVINSANWDRSAYISYYFMNENDVDASSVNFKNTSTSAKTSGAYVYFCNSNLKYEITGQSATLVLCENEEGASYHVHNPKADAYMEATCTTAEGNFTFCFCGAELSFVKAENGDDALGHIYNNVVNKIFPTIEGGALDYYADATYVYACPQCDKDVDRVEKGTSLFTKSGFSANEEDMTDVVFIVYINYANIEAYLSENEGVEIVYGLVASANTTGTPLTYANGKVEAAANTVKIDMTGLSYNKLTMRVTNVGNYSLHCAGYVSFNGEISYLNHETVDNTADVVSISIINDMLFPPEDEGTDEGTEEIPAE